MLLLLLLFCAAALSCPLPSTLAAAAVAACSAAHPDEHAHVDLAQAQQLQDLLCLQAAASNTGNTAQRRISPQLLHHCCVALSHGPAIPLTDLAVAHVQIATTSTVRALYMHSQKNSSC
jgi:hypothetical protein